MAEKLPPHSPVGASGAYRWFECPGSVSYSRGVHDEESEYAAQGTAAHELAVYCFTSEGDAWESVGHWFFHFKEGLVCYPPDDPMVLGMHAGTSSVIVTEVDKEMADAVQMFIDAVDKWHPDRNQGNFFVERGFHCPTIHPLFYGRSDAVFIDEAKRTLHVWDYKHGAGIVVDVRDNPQCKYYAIGILEELDLWQHIDKVVLHIAQPRGWHYDGPIRHWATTTEGLETWLDDDLIPAMNRAMTSTDTKSGEHCRFCPARAMACPQLMSDMVEMENLMATMVKKGGADKLTNAQVGRVLELFDVMKIAATAANKTAFSRMTAGEAKIPGRKLVNKRTNRVWKKGALKAIIAKLGRDEVMTKPELMSPAQIDGLPEGDKLTARWAFKPDGGMTVGAAKDTRVAITKDTKSLFQKQPRKGSS